MRKKKLKVEELVPLYGPFKSIWREEESDLLRLGMDNHILTVQSWDNGNGLCASVGHHLVNVESIFESSKPMPRELEIDDFWYVEGIEP